MTSNKSTIVENVTRHMNDKGARSLVRLLYQGYEIGRTDLMVELTRSEEECIIIDTEGNQWKLVKATKEQLGE